MTPKPVAEFMASLFQERWREWNLLDAGAGAGALSAALVRRLCSERQRPSKITVTAYEIDPGLTGHLREAYEQCRTECARHKIEFTAKVFNEDFIKAAVPMVSRDLFSSSQTPFNAVILNPPYRKINSNSTSRMLLRAAEIETSNLYAGFLALSIKLLSNGGELVAITPRSFCNGPYFKPFREQFFAAMSLRRLHLFESRSAAFQEDAVLQENVIVHAVKLRTKPDRVTISTSSGEPGGKVTERECAFSQVVSQRDADQFIHVVTDDSQDDVRKRMARFTTSLTGLALMVSTGRVVDFRAKEFLVPDPTTETVPLIYPCHFSDSFVRWPKLNGRKPNAIRNNERTQDLLVPAGIYVLVKRFTSKEEPRRVVACIYDPSRIRADLVGFENHLNYFHANGAGLTMNLAKGLAAFLNSTLVDNYFRQFNGHTQVNATDLRNLNYPTRAELEALGHKIKDTLPGQAKLDELIQREFF